MFRFILLLFLVLPLNGEAQAQIDSNSIRLQDEGSTLGQVKTLNCVGTGIACTRSSSTGTLTVAGGGGGGDNITVNGVAIVDGDLDDATPTAPAGGTNVKWQQDGSSPANVSGYVDWGVALDGIRRKPFYFNDLLGNTGTAVIEPWNVVLIGSGTQAKIVGEASHPGILRFSSSTTANSGGKLQTDITAFLLAGGETTDIVFQARVSTATTHRLGFHDATTVTDAVDGAYVELAAGSLNATCKTASFSSRTTSATIAALSLSTWYRVRVAVNSSATQVTCTIWNDAGTQLGTQTNTTNIPTGAGRNTGHGIIATNSGTVATLLVYIDYISVWWDTKALTR